MAAPFADWSLTAIRRRDIRAWVASLRNKRANDRRGRRKLSPKSVKECLLLLRKCLQDAIDDELIDANPAARIKVQRAGKRDDAWTYLELAEQHAIEQATAIAEADRLCILFALGTGLRQGEQWNLELVDVDVDSDAPHVRVLYGGAGHAPPKHDRVRNVPLFGVALRAARRQLELLEVSRWPNRHRLLWPSPRGYRRQKSKNYGFAEHLELAGITRHVRWHDLRHSAASSLVAGWWGERWSLQEVCTLLGHSSVTVTERYAHLAPSVLAERARRTTAAPEVCNESATEPEIPKVKTAEILKDVGRLRGQDLNLRPSGYEPPGKGNRAHDLAPLRCNSVAELAARYLVAVAKGDEHAHDRGIELAEAVLEAAAVRAEAEAG